VHPAATGGVLGHGLPRGTTDAVDRSTAALVQRSWAHVEPRADELAKYFYASLFFTMPESRELFPINMQIQRARLLRTVAHVIQQLGHPEDVRPFLAQLGRDHRKFGVRAGHYRPFGQAFVGAVRHVSGPVWSAELEHAWRRAFEFLTGEMSRAAAEDPGPASWLGRVVEHHRPSPGIAIVHVQTSIPIPYRAGQYVSVETPRRPRAWRYLSPANAPNANGVLEFHIRAVPDGSVSGTIVSHTHRAETWRIGPALGQLPFQIDPGRGLLLIAGGTGIAPMKAILEEMAGRSDGRRTELFLGARRWSDLYALDTVRAMSYRNPWLNVIPVVEHDETGSGAEHGTLADVVTRYGAWSDHEVLVAGSPEMIRSTVSRMLVAGTPLNRIHYDPFVVD
jgi:NAD(P)H-flavin reductase